MAASGTDLQFGLLGPLQVELGGKAAPVAGRKPRALLAALLLHINRTVSRDALIDALWPDDPPETAANTIQVYVSQLRRALPAVVVETDGSGYVLRADPESIDAQRFERLVEAALEPGIAPDAVLRLLDDALALWRGVPLSDLPADSPPRADAARFTEIRLQAIGRRIEAELQLGRHLEVLAELEELTRTEPFREQFTAQLMVALYRSARQAEALAAYQRLRTQLQEDLGLEPTPQLRELERSILNQDPSLIATPLPTHELFGELRKPVTVLAATFDRRTDLDVETEALVAARISSFASRKVADQEGVLLPTVDGSVVALFGVPYAHEDDAARATRAALQLQQGLAELLAELGQLAGDLHVRAAVGTTITVVPAPERGATSMPASVAASTVALARAAAPDVILLAPTTFALVKDEFAALPAEGEHSWRLTGVRTSVREAKAAFVGRSVELARLEADFRSAVVTGRVVERRIVGAAGVGKTRLADELSRMLESKATVLRTACSTADSGYATLAMLVEDALTKTGDSRISELFGPDARDDDATEILEALTGRGSDAHAGGNVASAVAVLLERLAKRQPLVVIFDDVHWAEQELTEALDAIREQLERGPVLFITAARNEEAEDAPVDTLALEPLDLGDAQQLADDLLGGEMSPELRHDVAAASEGNPLFVEQLAAVVAEAGALPPIPPTIHALLSARLDRLAANERRALQAGAIAGRSFTTAQLAAILGEGEKSLAPLLGDLVRRQLLSTDGGESWRFRHGLLREAAYDSLPKRRRAELHELFARRHADEDGALAFHLEQAWRLRHELGDAGDEFEALREEAASALAVAGEQAFRRVDMPASRSLLERAAELMPREHSRRAPLLLELAEATRNAGRLQEALAVLEEIDELPGIDPLLEAQAHLARLRIRHLLDSSALTAEARTQLDDAMSLFERADDHARLAEAWFLRAWFEWLRCQAGAADDALDRSIEHARRVRDRRLEGNAVHFKVGVVLYGPLEVEQAISFCRQLLVRYEDEPPFLASAHRGLAGLLAMRGVFDEARAHIAEDKEIMERLGLKISAAAGTELYAFVHLLAEELEAAEAELRTGCEIFEEMGERNSLSTFYADLAQVRWQRGDVEETLALATRAAEYAQADDLHTQVQARGPQAKALAALGRFDEAERIAREAVTVGAATDFLAMRAVAALDLGEVLRRAGREDEARAAGEEALDLFERKGHSVGVESARRFIRADGGPDPRPRAGTAARPRASGQPQTPD
jgi:DNA-binding SARP family transcriptional activator/tetratricopeptide (TPR) repeat protein